MSYRRSGLLCVALLLGASSATAQSITSLDLTGTRVAYDGYLASNAVTVAPAYSSSGARGSALASVIATFFESGSVSTVFGFDGARRLLKDGPGALDLRGSAGMSFYGGIPAIDLIGGPRLTRAWPTGAVWAGAEAGVLAGRSSEGGATRLSIGSWWERGPLALRASAQPTWIHAAVFSDVVFDAALRGLGGRLRLGLAAGQRVTTIDSIRGAFAAGETRLRLARRVELTVAGGRSLPDLLRRTPGARYASAGLRVSTGASRELLPGTPRPRPAPDATSLIDATMVGDSVVVRIRAATANRVEISGDFSDWEPLALRRSTTGEWRAALLLTQGVYRYNVRVDGGDWIVPAGAGRVNDDFGSEVGILVVRSP